MTRGPFHTDYRIWAFAAASVFLALGFVDPLAGAMWKDDYSLWAQVGILVRGDYICSTADILTPIAFRALLHTVPAAALGWVLQAFVVVLWSAGWPGLNSVKPRRPPWLRPCWL
jgi:hypothetical protein